MMINVSLENEILLEKNINEKTKEIIDKIKQIDNPYRCDIKIFCKEEDDYNYDYEYKDEDDYEDEENEKENIEIKITTHKKSINEKNTIIKEYNENLILINKKFYSKKNCIYSSYNSYGKIDFKSFTINGEKTRYIHYYDDRFVENIKCSTKKRKDDIRLDRGKVFLRTCNGIEYYLLTPNNYYRDEGFIQIIKDKKQIDLISIRFHMGVTRRVAFDSLKNAGEFIDLNTSNYYILDFKNATYKIDREREERWD